MNRKAYSLFFILFWLIAFTALYCCKRQEAEIPSYIKIDSIRVNTNYSSTGTSSHKISDAWVYINDNYVGTYELPAQFPVLASGQKRIKIRPGILKNGSSDSREYYYFYEEYEQDAELVPSEVTTLKPLVSYKDNVEIAWHEDFESAGNSFEYHPNSDTIVRKTSDPDLVFEGTASGIVNLDDDNDFFEWISPSFTDLPDNGRIFLELNYKTSHELIAGIYISGKTEQLRNNVIRPKDKWNKIYLEFTDLVARYKSSQDVYFFMGFQKNEGEKAEVLFDNIKLVHFK